MRIAVVHDWLYTYGGAERVLRSILRCYPTADVFSLFDVLTGADRDRIGLGRVHTSFLQRAPGIAKRHRMYLPIMPLAIEQLDLRGYDLVLSSSYAVAKGVLTGPDQLHVSYVHSPMRYAWDLQHEYLSEAGYDRGLKGALARVMLHGMRMWDTRTAHGVDAYLANSHFVARRVRKAYGREATVIHPPVDVSGALVARPRESHFFTASRLVGYKNVRAIVEAFALCPDRKLIVAGTGPEFARIAAVAGPNVTMAGHVPDEEMRRLMGTAQAFVFAAEEDFGIVPVEAQAEGTPVIALRRGGVRETVVEDGPSPTGLFFDAPTPAAIAAAIDDFAADPGRFSPDACHANAARFSEGRFVREFTGFVDEQVAHFQHRLTAGRLRPLPAAMLQAAD